MDRVKDVVQLPQDWVNRTLVNYSPSAAKQLLEREARCLQVSQQVYRTSPVEIPPQHIETLVTARYTGRSPYRIEQAIEDYHKVAKMVYHYGSGRRGSTADCGRRHGLRSPAIQRRSNHSMGRELLLQHWGWTHRYWLHIDGARRLGARLLQFARAPRPAIRLDATGLRFCLPGVCA